MEYPKINSLYKREGCGAYDETKKRYVSDLEKKPRKSAIIEGDYACPEFEAIKTWTVTEKVDGTNVRIVFDRDKGAIDIRGRTDNAQFPTFLFSYLQSTFSWQKLEEIFKDSNYVILFGEGYGPKIQSGGYYRKDAAFILFDVFCSGWWFKRDDLAVVAEQLGIDYCKNLLNPYMATQTDIWTVEECVKYVKSQQNSTIAQVEDHVMEGIVARSQPQMMFRKGGQIMFKLKCDDFKK